MVDFEFITKWLKIKGKNLKGSDLLVTLLFLAFVITLILATAARINLPNVRVLFQ